MSKKYRSSFTLIELMVVILIIAMLASIIVVGVGYARKKGRDTEKVADSNKAAAALNNYYLDRQSYPASLTDLTTLPAYLEKNVTGLNYQYSAPNYWLYFDPEVIDATCLDCNGYGDIYLIKNGKVSSDW